MTSISVDLDTLEEVRYKMRSFLVGEPTKTNNSIQLASPGGAQDLHGLTPRLHGLNSLKEIHYKL